MYSILKSSLFSILFAIAMISLPVETSAVPPSDETTEIAKRDRGRWDRGSRWDRDRGNRVRYYSNRGYYRTNPYTYSPYYSSYRYSSYPYYYSAYPYQYNTYDTYPYNSYYGSGLGFSIRVG